MTHSNIIARVLCTIYLVISLTVQWVTIWIVQNIFKLVAFPFTTKEQRQDVCGYIFRYISFLGMDILNPFWHVHVRNSFPDPKSQKVILMMNHLSSADPFTSIRAFFPRDGSWVCKSGLFKIPFGGWGLANAGDLCVYFKHKSESFETIKGSVGPMMENARAKLRRGRMLCIYPEGTRNRHPEGPLCPFRLGFFSLAIEEGAVIVPLAVSGSEQLWPRGSAWMDSADVYYTYGEPIEPFGFSSPEELATHTWNVINSLRETHPDRVALKNSYNVDDVIKVAVNGTHEFINNSNNNNTTNKTNEYSNVHNGYKDNNYIENRSSHYINSNNNTSINSHENGNKLMQTANANGKMNAKTNGIVSNNALSNENSNGTKHKKES